MKPWILALVALASAPSWAANTSVTGIPAFVQAGTGAVGRSMQDKARELVSVKDFGAKGDGSADDTAAVQAALTTGRDVYVPAGTYRLTNAVAYAAAGQSLAGSGPNAVLVQSVAGKLAITGTSLSGLVLRNLTVKPAPSHTANSGAGRNDAIKFINSDRVKVSGVTVDYSGSTSAHSGMWFENCNYCEVRGNVFTGAPSTNGVYFVEGGDDITFNGDASYNIVAGNHCVSGQVTGIQFSSGSGVSKGNVIADNVVMNASAYGIIAYKTNVAATFRDLTISGNHVENITGGVLSDGVPPSTVRKFGAGLYLQGIWDVTIVGNTIRNVAQQTNNATLAIGCISGAQASGTVTGNQCSTSGTKGIYFSTYAAGGAFPDPSDSGIVISDNVVKAAVEEAIFINQARRAIVSGNSILRTATATSGAAIRSLTDGVVLPDLVISNNHVNATAAAALIGVQVYPARSVEALGNSIFGVSTGISISTAAKINVQGNTIKTATTGINYDSGVTDGIVAGNHIDSASTAGIISNGYAKVYGNTYTSCTANNSGTYSQLATAAPAAGTWKLGDTVMNSAPAASGYIGWVATANGTPGTWKGFGAIAP